MTAPMTEGQLKALSLRILDIVRGVGGYRGGSTLEHVMSEIRHNMPDVPAGGAVTLEALSRILHEEGVGVTSWSGDALSRAAARLSAPQPVAFDVEAVALEIVEALVDGPSSIERQLTAAILRRHAAAPVVGVVTARDIAFGVAAGEEYANKIRAKDPVGWDDAAAIAINARLRARAGTAGQTTGAQWVRRPEGQASAWPSMPQSVCYIVRDAEGLWSTMMSIEDRGVTAWAHINRDTGERGPVIERTPATAGGWTEEVCEAAAAAEWINVDQRGIPSGFDRINAWHVGTRTAYQLAHDMKSNGVKAYCVIPPVEAQP